MPDTKCTIFLNVVYSIPVYTSFGWSKLLWQHLRNLYIRQISFHLALNPPFASYIVEIVVKCPIRFMMCSRLFFPWGLGDIVLRKFENLEGHMNGDQLNDKKSLNRKHMYAQKKGKSKQALITIAAFCANDNFSTHMVNILMLEGSLHNIFKPSFHPLTH